MDEKLPSSLAAATKETDEVHEAKLSVRRRSSSSRCDTLKCDKETFSAAATKNEAQSVDIKARKSSIVAKKSFESDSEATTASPPTSICMGGLRVDGSCSEIANLPSYKRRSFDTQPSDDDVANAQSKHVETQQYEIEAQEIEMCTDDAGIECHMRKASIDESYKCCQSKRKSIDDKSKKVFVPQHTISQEDDYDIGLVSGLLPGLSDLNKLPI